MRVTKTITFDAAHRLPSHPGACRNIHGHTYRVDFTMRGELNERGMVVDFGKVAQILRAVLVEDEDTAWDHALIVYEHDPLAKTFQQLAAEGLRVRRVPAEPTAENMTEWLWQMLQGKLRDQEPSAVLVEIAVWETATSVARYFGPQVLR